MGVITIGPLALSLERAFGLLGIIAFLVGAGFAERKWRVPAGWDGGAAISGLVIGRLWYVGANASVFVRDPLSVLFVWQGGFSPLGALAGSEYSPCGIFEAASGKHIRRLECLWWLSLSG